MAPHVVAAPQALARTIDWMVANRAAMAQAEQQLGDPFDYAREDQLIAAWERASGAATDYPLPPAAHMYRHPSVPGEGWRPA